MSWLKARTLVNWKTFASGLIKSNKSVGKQGKVCRQLGVIFVLLPGN